MPDHIIETAERGIPFKTLEDILPEESKLKMLFVTKAPTPDCVEKGHYFQGSQGISFWNKLKEYSILNVPAGEYEDDYLAGQSFGLVSISKRPGKYGDEPHPVDYLGGVDRLIRVINKFQPEILVFVYKSILERFLRYAFRAKCKPVYGFNDGLDEYFKAKIFIFPMPGTPCTALDSHESMLKLKSILSDM
jgi:hypothetical protein